jgi:hypothetical protein
MNTSTKLSALALAAAAFTATTLLAGAASAHGFGGFGRGFGHGPVVTGTGSAEAPRPTRLGGSIGIPSGFHVPPGALRPLPYHPTGSNPPSHGGGEVVSCHPGTGCSVTPTGSNPPSHGGGEVVSCHPGTGCSVTPTGGDRDHDGYHRGYDRDRWFGWRGRPEIIVDGGPAVFAPVQVAAGGVSAPVQATPGGPAPAPQAAEGPFNCLTKQYLPDGSVVFQDICTKESAIAAPQSVGAR